MKRKDKTEDKSLPTLKQYLLGALDNLRAQDPKGDYASERYVEIMFLEHYINLEGKEWDDE